MCSVDLTTAPLPDSEPEKQFALVREHINQIQLIPEFKYSAIVVMVELNL